MTMNKKVTLFLFLILILNSTCISGAEHTFSKLSVENGLSNNEVNAIYKDSHGFVWFGTLLGLDRFDGVEIRSYAAKFPDQVENILSIEEDSKNEIWVGTSNGIYKYYQDKDLFQKIKLGVEGNISIKVIKPVSDSLLFLGTNRGLVVLNYYTNKVQHFMLDSDTANGMNQVSDILSDDHGSCWLATQNGLVRFLVDTGEQLSFYLNSEGQHELNNFSSICGVGNKLYLGTVNNGIVEFNLNSKTFSKSRLLSNNLITTLKSDNRENLYVGTNGSGLIIINLRTNAVQIIQKEEDDTRSLSSNSIYSFLLDENQRYWIGTYSGGVNYSNTISGGFQLHPVSTDFPSINKSIRSFYFAPDGNQYFGTRNGFVHYNRDKTIKVFRSDNTDNLLRSNIILALYPFQDKILIGTYGGGISSYDPARQKMVPLIREIENKNGSNYAFSSDRKGNLWIASFEGIYRYNPITKDLDNFNHENSGLKDNQVFSLFIDSKDRIWVGTRIGFSVFEIRGESLVALKLPEKIDNTYKINDISEDQAGNIWICTEIGGLIVTDDDLNTFKIYRQKDGLPDNSVCSIIEYSPGNYWISTLKGFSHFSLSDDKFKNFSISDGLPGLVFSPAASYLANDGRLWFGNEKGLVGFYPEDISDRTVKSRIVITNLYIAGQNIVPGEKSILSKPIEFTKSITLDYKSSNIGFRFVDLNYLSPFDNNYFTILEGSETDWHNNGSSNEVFYKRLSPGNYVFKIKNALTTRDDSDTITELLITVKQPITRSIFFWLVLFLIIGVIGFYLVRLFNRLESIKKQYIREHQGMNKYQGSGLTDLDLNIIIEKVRQYVKSEKPYLNAELKLSDLSHELNIPSHHISQALNQILNQGFSDFINKYRVREVRYMLENDALQKYTLMAIARQCGFNSKTSFYRIFKKFTGKTPVDYLSSLEK